LKKKFEKEISFNNNEIDSKTLKIFFDKSPFAIQSLNESGHILNVSKAWLDILGYSKEDIIGKSFRDFLSDNCKDHFSECFPKFKEMGQISDAELEMKKKNGDIVFVSFNGKIIHDDKGNFKQTFCFLSDITNRKTIETELSESEEKFRELYNNMSTCMAIYQAIDDGQDFVIKGINKAGEEKSKVKIEEIKGKRVSDVFPSVKEIGLFDIFKKVYATGKPEYLPTKFYKDSRMSHWVENLFLKILDSFLLPLKVYTQLNR